MKATGAEQFSRSFRDASKGVEGLEKSTGAYSKSIQDAIRKSGGFIDAQGRLRNAQGQFMSVNEKAKYGLQGFGDEVEQTGKKLRKASISISSMIKAIAGSAAVVGAFRMITSSIDGAISRVDTLNTFPRVLEQMGFSASDSEKAISKLSDGIDGLPTTLDSVASTAQRLATMTGDLEGATDTTLALNNAFLASGASTADAARGLEQYVQMLSTGTVDLQSWRSLQETMPIALNKTAEAFGYTGKSAQNDLYEALKSGKITFDQFNDKIIELSNETGGFADLARESSTGIRTSWQNMKTAIVKGVADTINVIDDSLGSFGGISGIFDSAKRGIQVFFSWLNTAIPVAISFIQKINPAFQAVRDFVVPIVQSIVDFIIKLWGSLSNWWQENNTQIMTTAQTIWNTVSSVVGTVVQSIVDFVMSIWSSLTVFWEEHGEMIMNATRNFMNVVWSIMQALWPVIQFLVIDTWNAIKGAIQGAIKVITGIIQFFAALFTGNWSEMWDAVKKIVNGAVQFVINFIQVSLVGKALKLGRSLLTGFTNVIKSMWSKVTGLFKSGINSAYKAVTGKIKDFLNAGKNIVTSIADGIKNAVGKVTDAISGVTQKIRNFLPFSPAKEGALRDIMDIQIAQSIAQAIDKGKNVAVRSMANLTDALYGEMPQVDIAGQVRNIHSQSQKQMTYDFQNEMTISKQPAYINIRIGQTEFNAFVNDITNAQERKSARKRRFPK